MYKNLNPASLGVAGRQSELIELALTYGFRGLDLDAADMLKRATLQGVDEAAKYLHSAKVKVGGWVLPVHLEGNDQTFHADLERLSITADTAKRVGFTYTVFDVEPACDDLPYPDNFERHRHRLARVADVLAGQGIRLGVRLKAAAKHREGRTYPFVHKAEELLTLIRTTGHRNVGLALDTWNWTVGGGGDDQLSELSGEDFVTVCIADVPDNAEPATVETRERLLPTEGTIPRYAKLIARLAQQNYKGPVTLMPHHRQMASLTRDASVEKCADILRKIWTEAGLTKAGRAAAAEAAP
jgi:sugar phosphate isomerase/epimerase